MCEVIYQCFIRACSLRAVFTNFSEFEFPPPPAITPKLPFYFQFLSSSKTSRGPFLSCVTKFMYNSTQKKIAGRTWINSRMWNNILWIQHFVLRLLYLYYWKGTFWYFRNWSLCKTRFHRHSLSAKIWSLTIWLSSEMEKVLYKLCLLWLMSFQKQGE